MRVIALGPVAVGLDSCGELLPGAEFCAAGAVLGSWGELLLAGVLGPVAVGLDSCGELLPVTEFCAVGVVLGS